MNHALRYLNIGLPEDILRLKLGGELNEAIRMIDYRLQQEDLPYALRQCLIAEREICMRLPKEYPYTKEKALKLVQEHIPDFTEEEFDQRVDARKISWIYLNGEKHYFIRFFDTMEKTDVSIASRMVNTNSNEDCPSGDSGRQTLLDRSMHTFIEKGCISNQIRIRASIKIKEEFFVPGMAVRVHLPIPANCAQQKDIVIEQVFPAGGVCSSPDSPQRTVFWEETMEQNHPFTVEYSYTYTGHYRDAYHLSLEELSKNCSDTPLTKQEIEAYTKEEAPHITFTPYIRQLAEELTNDCHTPLEKARAFYDFITLNMNYTFMPEYFVLENISESCARNYTGDCGVFALLFITLCRCAGIPACWQSGLCAEPDFCGCHDWARFYIDGAGWFYADPSFGVGSRRMGNEERRRYYFGNLDAYRMVANRSFQAEFVPAKKFWRADPYDNQVGEIETNTRGLLYTEFENSQEILKCTEIQ